MNVFPADRTCPTCDTWTKTITVDASFAPFPKIVNMRVFSFYLSVSGDANSYPLGTYAGADPI